MADTILGQYDAWLIQQGRRELTRLSYVQDIEMFMRWYEERHGSAFAPEVLSKETITQFRDYLQKTRGLKANTFYRKLSSLRSYVKWGLAEGIFETNPLVGFRAPTGKSPKPRVLNSKDVTAIFAAIEDEIRSPQRPADRALAIRDRLILRLALTAGLRLHEISALDADDFDLGWQQGEVHVRGNSPNRHRTILLSAQLKSDITAWLEIRPHADTQAAFLTVRYRNRISTRGIHVRIKRWGRIAKVYVSADILRHTCARNLVKAGASLGQVANYFGFTGEKLALKYFELVDA